MKTTHRRVSGSSLCGAFPDAAGRFGAAVSMNPRKAGGAR